MSTSAGELHTTQGVCGEENGNTETLALSEGRDPEHILREKGAEWVKQGYEKPAQSQLHVMTLHFQMRRWTGYPAGAPWYDDWTSGYLDPIQEILDTTCNGVPRSGERFSGDYLQSYVVFNTDLALEAVEQIAAAASVKFLLDIHIGRREKQVQIPIDPNVPEYLRTLFRIVEKSARSIAHELPVLFQGDPLQPEVLPEKSKHKRISGDLARQLREDLKEQWNFTSNFWNPLSEDSPHEVIFLNGMEEPNKQKIVQLLQQKVSLPFYLLDCEEGLFEIDSEEIFGAAHEGMVFDASLSWVIYFSHHFTITFGGDWLVKAVRNMYVGEEEKLNAW